MCKPKTPTVAPLPEARALARQPQNAMINRVTGNTNSRTTVVNPDGQIRRAPTAALGGTGVALGNTGGST